MSDDDAPPLPPDLAAGVASLAKFADLARPITDAAIGMRRTLMDAGFPEEVAADVAANFAKSTLQFVLAMALASARAPGG